MATDNTHTFHYAGRSIQINVLDILAVATDVIVNSVNTNLLHEGDQSAKIAAAAGVQLGYECEQLIREYGEFESGMAVYTSAGDLSFKGIVHVVAPWMGEGNEQAKIERAVTNCLLLCEANNWCSIAMPAISTGRRSVPVTTSANAIARAIVRFWDARMETAVESVVLCLQREHVDIFVTAVNLVNAGPPHDNNKLQIETASVRANDAANASQDDMVTGIVELSDDEIAGVDDESISDWFKKT